MQVYSLSYHCFQFMYVLFFNFRVVLDALVKSVRLLLSQGREVCCFIHFNVPHECTYFSGRPKSSSTPNDRIPSFIQSSCPRLHFAWREREARNGTKFCPSLMQPDLAEEKGRPSVAPIQGKSSRPFFLGIKTSKSKASLAVRTMWHRLIRFCPLASTGFEATWASCQSK